MPRGSSVRLRRPRRIAVLAAIPLLVAGLTAGCGDGGDDGRGDEARITPSSSAAGSLPVLTWIDTAAAEETVPSLSLLRGRIDLDPSVDQVTLSLDHARLVALPDACEPSTVVRRRSYVDGGQLRCPLVDGATTLTLTAIAFGRTGQSVGGQVSLLSGDEVERSPVPGRALDGGPSTLSPDLRLLSSPDFLNADVGDLRTGPGSWKDKPRATRSANSTTADYEKTLDGILSDWQGLDPAGVLVAGDLVDGRWGYDDARTGNFGPVTTTTQRRAALRRAARTYYPQWKQRFAAHGLTPYPAMGDHEYGDNPWPRRKRELAADFRSEWAREFTTDRSGAPLFRDHPQGPAATTAYAGRPTPEVQIVTIEVFDIPPARARVGLDRQQLTWLRGVLAKAKRDGVKFVIVQGHVPILFPVRARGSSLLHYPGAESSRLWKLFRRYDVDLYLCGEVHDTTAKEQGGVVQISHGGAFQFGLTTSLLMDFYGDRLYVTLRDYNVRHSDAPDGSRLWETRRAGLPRRISLAARPVTIGTATIKDGHLVAPSGVLAPLG
ncbi:hypothetical protein BH11ACT8_BH11ACT8_26000 [soil metagenome]